MGTINTSEIFGRGENASFQYTIQGLNNASNLLLFDFLMIVLFVVVLFILRNYELRDGLLAASSIAWIFSLFLWVGEFTDFTRPVVCFCVLVIAIGMTWMKD